MASGRMMTINGKALELGELPFELYVMDQMGKLVLFGRKGIEITEEIHSNIKKSNRTFYISTSDASAYIDYTLRKMKQIKNDPNVSTTVKQSIIKDAGSKIVQKIHQEGFSKESVTHTKELTDNVVDLVVGSPQSYSGLLNISSLSSYIYDHALNTCTFAIMIGMEIYGPSQSKLFLIGQGTLLMDIGMTKVNPAIVKKSGKLTDSEFKQVQEHTRIGYNMLKQNGMHEFVCDMALHHHERLDGSGYPDGLSNKQIRPYLRIAAAADVYDALTSQRSYRRANKHIEAIEFMLKHREMFSDDVLRALMRIVLKNDKLVEMKLGSHN